MGYEPDQFVSSVDTELLCPMCYCVLQDPVQGSACDHLYCRACIRGWLKQSSRCPVDRKYLCESQLRQTPKIIINLLNRLEVRCVYDKDGCDWVVRLGDFEDHLAWCPFSPAHPHCHRMRAVDKTGHSSLKQLRVMADFEPDLKTIRNDLKCLQMNFEWQSEQSRKFNDAFDRFGEMILDLEEQFKRVTDPLMKFISKDGVKPAGHEEEQNQATCCVSINNLNEFICESVISEYLRQNNIFVAKCTRTLGYNERSRNFHVTVRMSDLDKLLIADLWPRGVTLSVRGDYRTPSVHGTREKNLPGLTISSGMSYWHS